MKKYLLPPIISFLAISAVIHGVDPLTSLFIAGVVPGTTLVLPFWVMVLIYCLAITVIVTTYVEDVFEVIKEHKLSLKRKNHLPRRRYSEL